MPMLCIPPKAHCKTSKIDKRKHPRKHTPTHPGHQHTSLRPAPSPTGPQNAGSEQEHDFRAVLCSMVAYLRDHNAWATLACLLASCAARGCVLLSAHATSPLSPEDLSPESVAALSGNAAACQCHAGGWAGALFSKYAHIICIARAQEQRWLSPPGLHRFSEGASSACPRIDVAFYRRTVQ